MSGNWKDHRELHLEPNWILVYHITEDILVLSLVRAGTHSDIFNK
ncbi:MAG: type II toxin-antitoxin system YafQ family toxin [Lachnospiraceae bacterium]|nr:type II toxin-antitoxin system YafQ family toxin [Lachnospiraceae bacterium]